jgi:hypothetical protein
MNHTVVVVLEREFGEKVVALSERTHVWLVDSPVNRAAAEPIWARLKRDPPADALAQGLTLFQSLPKASPEEAFADILDTIAEHHPRMTVLEVYGVRDQRLVEPALATIRFIVSHSEPDHLVASISTTGPG